MSEPAEQVAVVCPSCSPQTETVHEVLKEGGGGHATVRCTECGHVHKVSVERETTVERDVVVSQGDESVSTTVDAPAEEVIAVGEEFIVDTPEAIMLARITSLDLGEDRRVDEATVEDVRTIWTRAVDNVSVNVTVHPKDGRRDETRSLTVQVPGDYEFTVGEVEAFGDEKFEVEGIHVRDDSSGYRFDKFDHEGDVVFAKDAKRVYARDETSTAWSAW
ncbi:HVO_0476 family zinc finger protein [Halegenticoccus tardaugens]|uniref:HVO_0476 family zinc finger protein n=1 Tax=Halegenticoccus tardaugens TaxID=2071624 RepID=UPI00100A8044|nr:HVO_0476 family zinc finger protein [Halegenticoccus tardaugens]